MPSVIPVCFVWQAPNSGARAVWNAGPPDIRSAGRPDFPLPAIHSRGPTPFNPSQKSHLCDPCLVGYVWVAGWPKCGQARRPERNSSSRNCADDEPHTSLYEA